MRLSDYLIRPISTSTEPSGQYEKQLEAYNLAVNLINRMTYPILTVCDIEQIKSEIKDCLWKLSEGNTYLDITREEVENGILEIINKHAEQEPTDEWQNGYDRAWEEAEVFYEKEEPTCPCDLCRFNPPSSADGKPCTMCPAEKGGE